jgi:hypothetical protein
MTLPKGKRRPKSDWDVRLATDRERAAHEPLRDEFVGRRYRLKSNPSEVAWCRFWQGVNGGSRGRRIVDLLMADDRGDLRAVPDAKPSDMAAIARVLQWLGTPVGASMLEDFIHSEAGKPIRERLLWRLTPREVRRG